MPASQIRSKLESAGSPFQFVSELAKELSAGRVELPSFPDAAARVQQVLSDDSVTSERIARVVSADAGLAARVLTMANSTLLHRGGAPVTDLKVAVTRIGHDNIRTAALAYANAQLRRAAELAHIRARARAAAGRKACASPRWRTPWPRNRGACAPTRRCWPGCCTTSARSTSSRARPRTRCQVSSIRRGAARLASEHRSGA